MKRIMLVILALLLCGCSNSANIQNEFNEIFENEVNSNLRANNYGKYIEYCVSSDVHEEDCDNLSFVFSIEDCKFIMNINVSGIINNEYYKDSALLNDGYFDSDKLIYSSDGSYTKANHVYQYHFRAYESDDEVLLYYVIPTVSCYGYGNKKFAGLLANKMVSIARNAKVNEEKIIEDYSSKDVIDYQKTVDDLFGEYFPVDGRVEDMMKNQGGKVSDN